MSKPVTVYGASGYAGRLICDYLREFNLPFTAAGHLDATGEQDWLITCDEKYGAQMAGKNLLRVLTGQASAVMSEMPPRENTRINTSLDSVPASGPLGRTGESSTDEEKDG